MAFWISIVVAVLFLLLFGLTAYVCFIRGSLSLAPWVPTSRKDLARLPALIQLQPGQKLYEIGAGDARVSTFLAKQFPEARVTGIEISPLMWFLGRTRVLLSGARNLTLVCGDAMKMDLRDADVLYIYGLPKTVNQKLIPKLRSELKSGARLVSYAFAIEGENVHADRVQGASSVYIYTQP